MLFNSFSFIFLFLPLVLWVFLRLETHHRKLALTWLVVASFFFYAWWNPGYLFLLLISITFNFSIGRILQRRSGQRCWLITGIAGNILLLSYFKYAGFLVSSSNSVFNTSWEISTIVLPLAISFFTFQQIAWLVDVYRGIGREYNPVHYCLFVSFFPQLIAGPIVHHTEMMPQFSKEREITQKKLDLEVGLTLFCLGLLKKVVLADTAAGFANPVFEAAGRGEYLTFFEAWIGTLAYTFQIYFDFSGYSDMAIGLARMFGIHLPINFFSPYKACNIREFWQRWHITLSRFLRDYVYFALGGNRKGISRTFINIMFTMLIGGLWHGAAWTFVCWGGLHGLLLLLHRVWIKLTIPIRPTLEASSLMRLISIAITFFSVCGCWVLFRADSFPAASVVYKGMLGFNGYVLPPEAHALLGKKAEWFQSFGMEFHALRYFYSSHQLEWLPLLALIVFFLPNSQQWLAAYQPALIPKGIELSGKTRCLWHPHPIWALVIAVLVSWALLAMNRVDEFLYFQF